MGLIVLVRHGLTEGAAGRAVGRLDLPLSEAGRAQAADLAAGLGDAAWAALYASPLARARETLAPLARRAGLRPALLNGLAEISLGAWEGLAWTDIRARFPAQYAARGRDLAHCPPPGGESFADLAGRANAALDALAAGPLPALAATHAGVIRVLLARVLDLPLSGVFRFAPGEGLCTVLEPGPAGPRLAGFNLTPNQVAEVLAGHEEEAV